MELFSIPLNIIVSIFKLANLNIKNILLLSKKYYEFKDKLLLLLVYNCKYKIKKEYVNIKIFNLKHNLINFINIKIIIFDDLFNRDLQLLPENIEELKFGKYFNREINLSYLKKLIKLTFGNNFNKNIENKLPENLKILDLGLKFNKSLDKLPENLKELIISDKFNQKLDFLPKYLRKLTLGHKFNQDLINLPKYLEEINFNGCFDKLIKFPENIIRIKNLIHENEDQVFPSKLEYLEFNSITSQNLLLDNCSNLKSLIFHYYNRKYKDLLIEENIEFIDEIQEEENIICTINFSFLINLKVLVFDDNFNEYIDCYPQQLEELILGMKFNQSLDNLPESLKLLRIIKYDTFQNKYPIIPFEKLKYKFDEYGFGYYKKYQYNLLNLPKNLEELAFSFINETDINLTKLKKLKKLMLHSLPELPNNIEQLVFNKFIKEVNLPKKLTRLICDYFSEFNENIDFELNNLTYLKLNNSFNQPLNNLPDKLRYLNLASKFDNYFNSVENIEELYLDEEFNTDINYFLINCKKLKILNINEKFDQKINYLPNTLEKLILDCKYNKSIPIIPNSLLLLKLQYYNLSLTNNIFDINNNLTEIDFGYNFNQKIEKYLLALINLKKLTFGDNFNQIVNHLPINLKELVIGNSFNKRIDHLPINLEILVIGNSFNKKVNYLPINLKELNLGDSFNRPLNNLPNKLKTLKLGEKFNHSIENLTDSLKYLVLYHYLDKNQNLVINKLPINLKHLSFIDYKVIKPKINNKSKSLKIYYSYC